MPGPNLRADGALDPERVLADVKAMLADVIGEDYVSMVEIGPETSFQSDLEVESIELVALGEQLQDAYTHVDFAAWLSTMEVDEIIALTVGDLVDHITAGARAGAPVPAEVTRG